MAQLIDQYIDSAHGTFHFVVEDAHGVKSQHTVMLLASPAPNVPAIVTQTLADVDARCAEIDALSASLQVRVQ